MNFEEQFPSIKNLVVYERNIMFNVVKIPEELLMKNCIDKQRVKEIIERTFNLVVPSHKREYFNGLKIALLDEFGLE